MTGRRNLLKTLAGFAAALVLAGFLVSCKHGPEGQSDRNNPPDNRDGGDGGY